MHRIRNDNAARRRARRLARQVVCLLLVLFLNCHAVNADTNGDRRALVGLNLFRALLVADMDVGVAGTNAPVQVLVLYADDAIRAEQYREQLAQDLADIRGTPVSVVTQSLEAYLATPAPAGVGAFIAQRLSEQELAPVVAHSSAAGIALFSPFEGDVERGVLAGISVQAAVRPYINLHALEQTGVRLKPFFLKVAKLYE